MTGRSDDGQAGVTVTDADRRAALRLRVALMEAQTPEEADTAEGAIAVALAAERAEARAPFRRMALDIKDGWQPSADRLADAILIYTGGYGAENAP